MFHAAKFEGCLVGALVGDCLGEPFELRRNVAEEKLKLFLYDLLQNKTEKTLPYTDDTAMTICLAKSLIKHKKVCSKDLAERFVAEYFNDPDRCYGLHVPIVFQILKVSHFKDVFFPAKKQFNGEGSYGNGAAMRISPVALFAHDKDEDFIKDAVDKSSRVTHAHPDGINGAILQCFAIQLALKMDSSEKFEPAEFIAQLINKMKRIETTGKTPFCDSLELMKTFFLPEKKIISGVEAAKYFGNGETAVESIPTAIYSFLRSFDLIPGFEEQNPFVRTAYFAISAAGDTDTIASMACSIAGAYYGIDIIPDNIKNRCESIDGVKKLAEELLKAFGI